MNTLNLGVILSVISISWLCPALPIMTIIRSIPERLFKRLQV
jgi:hypothetical protein